MLPAQRAVQCDIRHSGAPRSAPADILLAGGAPRPPLCKGSRRMRKRRLDTLLAERGLFPSRSRAAASVMAGEVRVGAHGRRAAKPSELVEMDAELIVQERPRFVSRGGIKLANALADSGLDVAGRRALDLGASTGGFTD